MRKVAFVLLCALPFWACTSSEETAELIPQTLVKSDSVILPLPDKAIPWTTNLVYLDGESSWLFMMDQANNDILLYDLKKEKLQHTIDLQLEGVNGVGFIYGFQVESLSSIYLLPQGDPFIYQIDTSATLLKKYVYEEPPLYSEASHTSSHYSAPPLFSKGQVLVKTKFGGSFREMTSQMIQNGAMSYTIDLKDRAVKLSKHLYPKDYLDEGLRSWDLSMAASADQIVYSLFADHHVYFAEDTDEVLQKRLAKSKYIETFDTIPLKKGGLKIAEYLLASPHYENLLYDPYREVYYRFVIHRTTIKNSGHLIQLRQFADKFSIMVLDRSLRVLGETLFEEEFYVPNNAFVGKEGLYISRNHPERPTLDPSKMQFDVFVLSPLE